MSCLLYGGPGDPPAFTLTLMDTGPGAGFKAHPLQRGTQTLYCKPVPILAFYLSLIVCVICSFIYQLAEKFAFLKKIPSWTGGEQGPAGTAPPQLGVGAGRLPQKVAEGSGSAGQRGGSVRRMGRPPPHADRVPVSERQAGWREGRTGPLPSADSDVNL